MISENPNSGHKRSDKAVKRVNTKVAFPIVAMALLMITIDSTIVATALHALQQDLQTSVSWAGWTMTAYSLGFVLMLPLSAKLSIQYGHRRIFLLSVATFTLASLLCGLSTNIHMLIAFRALQAIGGAGITPSATGIIVNHFGRSRDRYLGLFGSFFAIGGMIGPVFGGVFVTYWTWHWIFYINIPFGLAVLIFAAHVIPKVRTPQLKKETMDFRGLAFLAVGILAAMYSATYLGNDPKNISSPLAIGLIALSIIGFVIFFRHLNRVKSPFINPTFITGKGFGAVNLLNLLHTGMVIGMASLIPFYAINRYGINELHAGSLLVVEGVASVVMSIIMSIYIRKTGYRKPLYVGAVILAVGVALIAFEPMLTLEPFIWLSTGTFLIGFGFGVMSPAARNAGIQLAPEQSANLAAIRSLGLQLGQIIAVAGATSIIAASLDPNRAHAMVYLGLAILLLITIPVISRVPENKGSW